MISFIIILDTSYWQSLGSSAHMPIVQDVVKQEQTRLTFPMSLQHPTVFFSPAAFLAACAGALRPAGNFGILFYPSARIHLSDFTWRTGLSSECGKRLFEQCHRRRLCHL